MMLATTRGKKARVRGDRKSSTGGGQRNVDRGRYFTAKIFAFMKHHLFTRQSEVWGRPVAL